MGDLRLQQVKTHRARFGALASNAMSNRLLGIFGHQALELALGSLVVEKGLAGFSEQPCEFAPGVGSAHIDNANGFNTRSRRLSVDQVRFLARLDAAPKLLFG